MTCYFRRVEAMFTALIFFVSISGCAAGTKNVHPEFKERHKHIRSVSVMPPDVEAYKLTFKGERVPLFDILPAMEEITVDELKTQFAKKGYEIKEMDLSDERLNNDPELKTVLFTVKKLFAKTLDDISRRKQKSFTYYLGSDVNIFADLADCDVLIFVNEQGLKKSTGEVVKDVVKNTLLIAAAAVFGIIYIPIAQTAITIVQVAVVDGNDGAVLWYRTNYPSSPSLSPDNKKALRYEIRKLVRKFPKRIAPDEE